ncbi:hypothetical protein OG21DRAFT_1526861 [Imleria badia]|nr:hypothetical protein OG21DRAFT_1526861 [Imleria badia]
MMGVRGMVWHEDEGKDKGVISDLCQIQNCLAPPLAAAEFDNLKSILGLVKDQDPTRLPPIKTETDKDQPFSLCEREGVVIVASVRGEGVSLLSSPSQGREAEEVFVITSVVSKKAVEEEEERLGEDVDVSLSSHQRRWEDGESESAVETVRSQSS